MLTQFLLETEVKFENVRSKFRHFQRQSLRSDNRQPERSSPRRRSKTINAGSQFVGQTALFRSRSEDLVEIYG
jgi:hypothetical protein